MEEKPNYITACHPVTGFCWYLLVIICAVMLQHPAYMSLTLLAAAVNYLCLTGTKGVKVLLGFIPLLVFLTLMNPLFNTYGERILFTVFGRNYTLEALCYGAVIALMFVSVLLLFLGYNRVITSDKFTTLFGRLIPALSLVLVMVLRLVPSYRRKAEQITQARACIGKGLNGKENFRQKAENGMIILGALTGWALESSVVTADSMRSRGYGTEKRTSFQLYRFHLRDLILLLIFLITFAVTITGVVMGAAFAEFTPVFEIREIRGWRVLPLVSYGILLFLPVILNCLEEIRWHILRSGI